MHFEFCPLRVSWPQNNPHFLNARNASVIVSFYNYHYVKVRLAMVLFVVTLGN